MTSTVIDIGNDIYICKYFAIQELVPRHVYADRGDKAWQLLDRAALITLDTLREDFGKIIVNDWMWNKNEETLLEWSGLRTELCPVGSMYSQHRFGRGFDPKFWDTPIDIVREAMINNHARYPYIKSIELNISWGHFDTRNCSGLLTYNAPTRK